MCPIMQALQKKGEYLKSSPECDRVEWRELRPKLFGIFPRPCHKDGTCLITTRTMGLMRDADKNPVPREMLGKNLAAYYYENTWHRKKLRAIRTRSAQIVSVMIELVRSVLRAGARSIF